MSRYTDAEKLYERFAGLEAQALDHIEKLNRIPFEEMTKEEYIEWRVWSAILGERSAFKHDVFDAPTADVQEVKHGKWIATPYTDYDDSYECSVCGNVWTFIEGTPKDSGANYCPNCGARMEERKEDVDTTD